MPHSWPTSGGGLIRADGPLNTADGALLRTLAKTVSERTLDDLAHMTRRHKRHQETSLRLAEYTLNNYAKCHPVGCPGGDLYTQYILYQKQFKRHHFGAFCRQADEWVPIVVEWKGNAIATSAAQVNFFVFLNDMRVLEWLQRVDGGVSNAQRVHEHRRAASRRSASRRGVQKRRTTLNPVWATPGGSVNVVVKR